MKTMLRVALAVVAICGFGKAYAFHSGGVAECGGCHSMHSPDPAGVHLLIGATATDTCLDCHANLPVLSSYHILTPASSMGPGVPPGNLTPGGDFGWLLKSYTFVVRNNTNVEDGFEHGHNVVAPAFGLNADPSNTVSPGGSFGAADFSCVSCHDMHGQYRQLSDGSIVRGGYYGQTGAGPFGATAPIVGSGSYATSITPIAGQAVGVYRLLWGAGAAIGGVTFAGNPIAYAPGTYNRSEVTSQTRVAYGRGSAVGTEPWGTWCATCHGAMHSGTGNYVHPVDQSMSALIPVYNNYVSSGDLSGSYTGDHLNQGPFLSLAPFMKNTQDPATLKALAKAGATGTALAGAADGDNVSCLSCHRAHASGFPFMLRWNMEGEFITYADTLGVGFQAIWAGTDNTSANNARGKTELETRTAYYLRPASFLGIYNRVLCNKCHGKD